MGKVIIIPNADFSKVALVREGHMTTLGVNDVTQGRYNAGVIEDDITTRIRTKNLISIMKNKIYNVSCSDGYLVSVLSYEDGNYIGAYTSEYTNNITFLSTTNYMAITIAKSDRTQDIAVSEIQQANVSYINEDSLSVVQSLSNTDFEQGTWKEGVKNPIIMSNRIRCSASITLESSTRYILRMLNEELVFGCGTLDPQGNYIDRTAGVWSRLVDIPELSESMELTINIKKIDESDFAPSDVSNLSVVLYSINQ